MKIMTTCHSNISLWHVTVPSVYTISHCLLINTLFKFAFRHLILKLRTHFCMSSHIITTEVEVCTAFLLLRTTISNSKLALFNRRISVMK